MTRPASAREGSTRELGDIGDPISALRSPSGSLISVYADRPSPGGFGALLSDLVKPIKERLGAFDRRIQKGVRWDMERIHGLADEFEADSAPAYAVFASQTDDVFVVEPLAYSTPSVSTIGPRPYLRPLRVLSPSLRSGIMVADRTMARTFVAMGRMVDEVGEALQADIGKPNFGGFAGYEEPGVRAHAWEESVRLWKEAAQRLLEKHVRRPFDYLAIGSHEELTEEITRMLHPYLARLQRVSFGASPHGLGLNQLRAEIAELDVEVCQRRHEALAGRVCDTAWSGGNAVLGLGATLDAANTQAIDSLVVAGQFTRAGAVCDGCGYLDRNARPCPICSASMFLVDDVVAAAMEAVVAAGGRVTQINVPSPLDQSGVGALTRFPVGER